MVDGLRKRITALPILILPALVTAAPDPPAPDRARPQELPSIELHLGIPDRAYIRQPLADLVKKYPSAVVVPFSGQDDVSIVKIADAGISCIAAGTPGDLKIASIGFNMDGVYEGIAEGGFRTSKGVRKGSTVNDLLEAYGEPLEILGEKQGALDRKVPIEDPAVPKMYQYASDDQAVKSYFLVQDNRVKRLVINDLTPLDQHIVKKPAKS